MLNNLTGFIEELVFETGVSFLKSVHEKNRFRKILNEYVEYQLEINKLCSLEEELDFESLYEYILNNLLPDIKIYLFDINIDKNKMREYILKKAQGISNAYENLQYKRVENIILQAINIIENFYKQQIDYNEWFLAANVVSKIIEETKMQNKQLLIDIRKFIDSDNEQFKNDDVMDIYSNLDKIYQYLFGDKKLDDINMRDTVEKYYDNETRVYTWKGMHFKIIKDEKDDILQTFFVDVLHNPITNTNMYHFDLVDKTECIYEDRIEVTFYIDNPSVSIDYLFLIYISKQKNTIVPYLLRLDCKAKKITCQPYPKAIAISDKFKKTGGFLAHFFNFEPINEIEYNYSIDIEQEYIIMDIESGEVIRPIVYYDTFTKSFKGKIYLNPTKYYLCFTIWSTLDLEI